MKNLKKLSIGLFAALSLTEIAYPNYNRSRSHGSGHQNQEQEGGAFFAGRAIGQNRQQENEGENETNEYYEEPEQVETRSFDDQDLDDYADENYADDAVVQIQSFGDGSRLSELTPEQKELIKGKLLERLNEQRQPQENSSPEQQVVTQSMDDEDEDYGDEDGAMIQALEEQDEQAPAEQNDKPSAQEIVQTEHQVQADLAQAAQAATNLVQATEQEEQAALPAEPVEISIEQTVAAQPNLLHEQSAQTVVQSPVVAQPALLQEQPAQPAAIEIVKIIKVYPVYDAVLSAVASVKAAAYDMINYAYSFIARK